MYYSYVEIEYVATSFSPARTDLALKLLNMQDQRNVYGFNQLFKGGKASIQSVVAHNVHKDFGRVQEGGTSLMVFRTITEHLDYDQLGKDETGLGRWLVMTFKGEMVSHTLCMDTTPAIMPNQIAVPHINGIIVILSLSARTSPALGSNFESILWHS